MKKALNIIKNTFVWLMVLLAVSMMIFTVISCTTFNRNDRSLFGYKMYIVNSYRVSVKVGILLESVVRIYINTDLLIYRVRFPGVLTN